MKNYKIDEVKNLLSNAKTALIAVPQLSVDSAGSALALAIALKKANIDAKVYCPQIPDANYSKLSGLELISNVYEQNDLVVTLNYPLDKIDQVSYNDDGGHLNLVVKTKEGSPKVENDQIIVNNQSALADVNFMLGDESSLGPNTAMVNKGNWIFVSPTNIPKTWAKATIVDQDAPFSEIFTFLLPMLGLKLDQDSGKNLLIALRVATQSFSINVSPETFEAGAICLRATQPSEAAPQAVQITEPVQDNQVNQSTQFNSVPTV